MMIFPCKEKTCIFAIGFLALMVNRGVSSVGSERMLDRHEVGSSILPRPTENERVTKENL